MTGEMKCRHLDVDDRRRLGLAVDELTWTWGRTLLGLRGVEPPLTPYDIHHGDERTQAVRLARLRVLKDLAEYVNLLTVQDTAMALDHGAEFNEVAQALNITRQAVIKRWGTIRQGDQVVVVISPRNRKHHDGDDPCGTYGEVGGDQQYQSDWGLWPVGKRVRADARYAVVAVNDTVRRIYEIVPDSWTEVRPRLWQFAAVSDRELSEQEIDAAYTAGELPLRPGDECFTRAGGAYRPHWF
uniref:hypothetical protein n=1 Tax=Streptomyces lavendulocolor TaxID=67316 RepID=UPI00340EF3DE